MAESYLFTPEADPHRESTWMRAESWVNTTIDALGMTPREAARAGGKARAELGMLLNDLDWRNDRQGEQGRPALMNVAWTARELATAAR